MVVMVATVAILAVVAVVALIAPVALVALVLVAPKVLRGIHSAAFEIGTRSGLVQIEDDGVKVSALLEQFSSLRRRFDVFRQHAPMRGLLHEHAPAGGIVFHDQNPKAGKLGPSACRVDLQGTHLRARARDRRVHRPRNGRVHRPPNRQLRLGPTPQTDLANHPSPAGDAPDHLPSSLSKWMLLV